MQPAPVTTPASSPVPASAPAPARAPSLIDRIVNTEAFGLWQFAYTIGLGYSTVSTKDGRCCFARGVIVLTMQHDDATSYEDCVYLLQNDTLEMIRYMAAKVSTISESERDQIVENLNTRILEYNEKTQALLIVYWRTAEPALFKITTIERSGAPSATLWNGDWRREPCPTNVYEIPPRWFAAGLMNTFGDAVEKRRIVQWWHRYLRGDADISVVAKMMRIYDDEVEEEKKSGAILAPRRSIQILEMYKMAFDSEKGNLFSKIYGGSGSDTSKRGIRSRVKAAVSEMATTMTNRMKCMVEYIEHLEHARVVGGGAPTLSEHETILAIKGLSDNAAKLVVVQCLTERVRLVAQNAGYTIMTGVSTLHWRNNLFREERCCVHRQTAGRECTCGGVGNETAGVRGKFDRVLWAPWHGPASVPCDFGECVASVAETAGALDAIRETAQQCSRCKHVVYCSAECQRADWPRHRTECTKLQ